jgi:hypothetical protein
MPGLRRIDIDAEAARLAEERKRATGGFGRDEPEDPREHAVWQVLANQRYGSLTHQGLARAILAAIDASEAQDG